MDYLECILPSGTNIPEAYSHGSDDDQAFVSNLALFFTAFFKVSAVLIVPGRLVSQGSQMCWT